MEANFARLLRVKCQYEKFLLLFFSLESFVCTLHFESISLGSVVGLVFVWYIPKSFSFCRRIEPLIHSVVPKPESLF